MENSQKPNERKDIKQAYRTAYLIAGFLKENLTGEEKEELDAWILASEENMILFEKMTDEKNLEQAAGWFKQLNVEEDLQKTKTKMQQRKPIRLWAYAIAAAIILIAAGIYTFQYSGNKPGTSPVAAGQQDIQPGADIATLTLDNGQQIVLDNEGADTTLSNQVQLLRKDGQLVYNNNTSAKELVYNTLTVPRKAGINSYCRMVLKYG